MSESAFRKSALVGDLPAALTRVLRKGRRPEQYLVLKGFSEIHLSQQKRNSIELTSRLVIFTNRRIISLNYTSVSELPSTEMLISRIERARASTCVAEVTDNHLPKLYIKTNDIRKVVSGEDATLEKADRHALVLLTTVGFKWWSNE